MGRSGRSRPPGPDAAAPFLDVSASIEFLDTARDKLSAGVVEGDGTKQHIALRAAQWLDVKTGTSSRNAVVLIEGGRISAVGTALAIPVGTTVIDLGTATLMPGLIDCHTHLMMALRPGELYAEHLLTR